MSKTFTAAKVLLYEDWLLFANSWRALVMGDKFIPLTKELEKEIEDAHIEYLKRDEEPDRASEHVTY